MQPLEFIYIAVLFGLVLLGALSPLLTFTALFQQKEWRMDRLREHVRREGRINSLIGRSRIIVVATLLAIAILAFGYVRYFYTAPTLLDNGMIDPWFSQTMGVIIIGVLMIAWVILFALLSLVQIVLRKQRMPVWTSKAMLVVLLSLTINILSLLTIPFAPLLLPIAQSMVVIVVLGLLKPIDYVLKKRVMDKAAALRVSLHDPIVIGIAGSVGKTTTKELIRTVLADLHPITTPAHVNTEMGVAQWLLAQKDLATKKHPVIIVEMGAYRKGEIALLCHIMKPTIGVMTALGSDHLALFGSEEEIVAANAELVAALPQDGHLFLDGSNERTATLKNQSPALTTVTSSASNIHDQAEGLQFSILNSQFSIPLHGLHNVSNALLAICVATHLGVPETRIQELLKGFQPTAHTFNVRQESGVLLLDDTYNVSPLSFRAALDWAKNQKQSPKTLLTSGLLELGKEEEKFLLELGKNAKDCVDRVIFTTKTGKDAFEKGFGKQVELLSESTSCAPEHSTLLCVGRMPPSSIQRLLPT